MRLCQVCGNEIAAAFAMCPYCGSRQPPPPVAPAAACRTVNLEKGMPSVDQALQRLKNELALARGGGIRGLIVIHGYGSSGRGGAIRDGVRRYLGLPAVRRSMREIVHGEDVDRRSGRCRQLAKRHPCLRPYLRRANPGITLVVL